MASAGNKKQPEVIKCVVVGDGNTGKTSLLTVYVRGEFPEDYIPTVFENYAQEITVERKTYMLGLWDTAGQEAFERLRPLSYGNADVIVLCYDVARQGSFENVSEKWVPEINHYCPNIPQILVACKTDLRQTEKKSKYHTASSSFKDNKSSSRKYQERIITTTEGEELSKKLKASAFIECSAKNNENVSTVFTTAAELVVLGKNKNNSQLCCILV